MLSRQRAMASCRTFFDRGVYWRLPIVLVDETDRPESRGACVLALVKILWEISPHQTRRGFVLLVAKL